MKSTKHHGAILVDGCEKSPDESAAKVSEIQEKFRETLEKRINKEIEAGNGSLKFDEGGADLFFKIGGDVIGEILSGDEFVKHDGRVNVDVSVSEPAEQDKAQRKLDIKVKPTK